MRLMAERYVSNGMLAWDAERLTKLLSRPLPYVSGFCGEDDAGVVSGGKRKILGM